MYRGVNSCLVLLKLQGRFPVMSGRSVRRKYLSSHQTPFFLLEELLQQKIDPEGYKEKVRQFKQQEQKVKEARKKNVGSLKPQCLIQ